MHCKIHKSYHHYIAAQIRTSYKEYDWSLLRNKKEQTVVLLAAFALTLLVMKTMTLDIVLSQDQNPLTTDKITQNTTSTLGPNLLTTSIGNITSGVARNMTK